jgi:hypothetical protein
VGEGDRRWALAASKSGSERRRFFAEETGGATGASLPTCDAPSLSESEDESEDGDGDVDDDDDSAAEDSVACFFRGAL